MRRFSPTNKSVVVATTAALSLFGVTASANAFTLFNGSGDGTLEVGVDGFGAFGSAVGGEATNALFDPIGEAGPTETTFQSGLAIGFGSQRQFLTGGSIGSSGGLTPPAVTGTPTSANSVFSFNGLNFNLTQTLNPLFNAGTQTGSVLTQTYTIANPTSSSLNFDLVRYIDGDLRFDGSISDGGGRIVTGGSEILFETDSATGTADLSTFVGITTQGGTTPTTNRYEIDSFSGLRNRIINGTALDNTITGDNNADQFIDTGNGYDVTLALRNELLLAAGNTTTYSTQTVFGAGEPGETVPGSSQQFPILPDVLEPGTFTFNDVPSGRWFDPPITSAFDYTMTSAGSLFSRIDNFPTGIDADNLFTVSVAGNTLGEFSTGQSVDFSSFAGGGVSAFTISSINPPVDAANPVAFPTQLSFTTPTASFTMSAAEATPVPFEPSPTLGLMGLGAWAAVSQLKRKLLKKA